MGRKQGKPQRGADGQELEAPSPEPVQQAQKDVQAERNARNYVIDKPEGLGSGGEVTKTQNNIAALKLLKKLTEEQRPATRDEQAALAKYVGWGGLKGAFESWNPDLGKRFYKEVESLLSPEEYSAARRSTINAHYTSPEVAQAMWNIAERLGFKGGTVLEPSMGIGNFFGLMPHDLASNSSLVGVELDKTSGAMAQLLYPDAQIMVKGYQDVVIPDNSLDFAIGNVPFSKTKIADPHYSDPKLSVHNYFLVKTLDKLKPGGGLAMITSRYTLDSQVDRAPRALMADRADLVAAIRLPESAFKKNAGTEVVTDLLIFRKRYPHEERSPESFGNIVEVAPGISVNEYFDRHPSHILGAQSLEGSMYAERQYTVKLEAGKLKDALDKAIDSLPKNVFNPGESVDHAERVASLNAATYAPDTVKEGAFTLHEGKLMRRENGVIVPLTAEQKAHALRIRSGIALRDQLKNVLRLQLETSNDDILKPEREKLNDLYDSYVKKFGLLNSPRSAAALSEDPEYPLLLSLENYSPKDKTAKKAPIFERRTSSPYEPLSKDTFPQDPKAGLSRILGATGRVDVDLISQLSGAPKEEVVKALSSQNLIFYDPVAGTYHTADEYLSGNVRQKLKDAKAAGSEYARNVAALEKVQPKRLTIHDIEPKLGQTFVPFEAYQAFITHLGKNVGADVKVFRLPGTGEWKIQTDRHFNDFHFQHQWAAGGRDGLSLLEDALNQKLPTVYVREGDTTRFDPERTMAAREMQQKIKDEYKDWVRQHPEWGPKLEDKYNDDINNLTLREYDGAHLTFPGMNPDISLMPHQVNFAWRVIQDGRGLAAHVVGAGKTFESIAAAMEMRRMGLSPKNMFVVPNNMLAQWRNDWQKLYPGANVLAVTDKDYAAKNRQRLMAKIATGDYDGIIVTHSAFDLLSVSPEREQEAIQKELDEARDVVEDLKSDARGNRRSIKDIEKKMEKLEERFSELNALRKDNAIYFDQLGVSSLFVDEAHAYKNLSFYTRMGQVSGINNAASKRASRMKMKTDFMLEKYKGRGVVFMTGTPVTNTMAEMYNMTRYVAPDLLEKAGIRSFDDWAANFGNVITAYEYSPDGVTLKPKAKFAEFTNLPELATQFNTFADVKSRDDLPVLKVPKANKHNVTVTITDAQGPLLEDIAARGERLGGPASERPEPTEDNWLKLSSDARKISLDPRLFEHFHPDDDGYKVNVAAKKIAQAWRDTAEQKGTQLVFSDFFRNYAVDGKTVAFDLFKELKQKLIEQGVPASQIAIINDYESKDAKEAVFAEMREGKVRVLMGSTEKMGVGVNVQARLKALHHLDQPWRPADVEQREGRIIRQGNQWPVVDIYRYISEPQHGKVYRIDKTGNKVEGEPPKAFDLQMFQKLETKQRFIDQIMSGKIDQRSMEDAGGAVVLDYATLKAVTTGNPDALKKVELSHELTKLSTLNRQWDSERSRARFEIRHKQEASLNYQAHRDALVPLDEAWKNADEGKAFSAVIDGRRFDERKKAVAYLESTKDKNRIGQGVSLYGLDIPIDQTLRNAFGGGTERIVQYKLGSFWHDMPATPAGIVASVEHNLRTSAEQIANSERIVKELRDEADVLRKSLEAPSPYSDKIKDAQKELAAVNVRLGLTPDGRPKDNTGEAGDAAATLDEGPPEEDEQIEKPNRNSERGAARLEALNPLFLLGEAAVKINKAYDRFIDRALQSLHLGRQNPEVERVDPEFAKLLREYNALPGYLRAKAESIDKQITGGLSRDHEKGFVLLADKASREWLAENRNADYQRYENDPAIQEALRKYKPYENELREAQRALGGPVIEEDYLRRVYEKHVAGVGEGGKAVENSPSLDRVITPQMASSKSRKASPDFYFRLGLHEFGPSFLTRYISTHLRLAEHNLAAHFMSRATKIDAGDELPAFIDYSGNRYYSSEAARLIKASRSNPEEGRSLARELGAEQLPKPWEAKTYKSYSPFVGSRIEGAARSLASSTLQANEQASGTKLRESDLDTLVGKSHGMMHNLGVRYLGPPEVIDALNSNGKHIVPNWIKQFQETVGPVTGALRQNILISGIPHIFNILRRTSLQRPIGQLDPRAWVDLFRVAFSRELKERGINGVEDPAFDALLRHAGMSPTAAIEYRHYLNLNFDKDAWKHAFNLFPALREAFEEPGAKGVAKGISRVVGEAMVLPGRGVQTAMKATVGKDFKDILFGPGGLDQRARLWLFGLIRSQEADISDADIADRVNEAYGRYAQAGWTDMQQNLAPFVIFPGWDYSSINWALKHPLRSRIPAALLVLLANAAIYYGLKANRGKDRYDAKHIHYKGRAYSTTLLNERLAIHDPLVSVPESLLLSKMRGQSNNQAVNDAVFGLRGDAGALIGMANPLLTTIPEVWANRRNVATPEEIVKRGDFNRRGNTVPKKYGGRGSEDVAWYLAGKVVPQVQEGAPTNGNDFVSWLGRNIGAPNYEDKGKRTR